MVATNLENEYKKFEDLINSYLTVDQSEIVKKAYDFAENAHGDQIRLTGDRFITHPLATA